MGFVVSSLPDYVEQNRLPLIKEVVLGGKTIERMQKQLGVKGSSALNLLANTPAFQDGKACGFSASGNTTFTQRTIVSGAIKVNMEFCPEGLIGKWNEYTVRVAANPDACPFEQEITDGIVAKINEKMEKAVWQGDTSSSDTDLKWFDGLLEVLSDASAPTESISSGASAYAAIKQVYNAIPAKAYEMGKVKLNCDPAIYRAFVQDLVEKNYFHYSAGEGAEGVLFPGTDVMVLPVNGLANTKKIVASADENLYYGCDLLDAKEEFKLWWSDDADIYRFKSRWNAGVQVAFPAYTVVGTMAAAPVAYSASAAMEASLSTIATGTTKLAGCVNSDNEIQTKEHA